MHCRLRLTVKSTCILLGHVHSARSMARGGGGRAHPVCNEVCLTCRFIELPLQHLSLLAALHSGGSETTHPQRRYFQTAGGGEQ